MATPAQLLSRYRLSLGIFVFGLIFSGLTAFPLLSELRLLASMLGVETPERYGDYEGLRHWIAYVLFGLEQMNERFPFLAYGTDWLAFGHLALAVFFLRGFVRPLESEWGPSMRVDVLCRSYSAGPDCGTNAWHPILLAHDRLLVRSTWRDPSFDLLEALEAAALN